MHLGILDFVVVFCYFGVLALVGIYFSKRQTSRSEYFLGGRQTHWALAGGSLLATIFSSISYLSVPRRDDPLRRWQLYRHIWRFHSLCLSSAGLCCR